MTRRFNPPPNWPEPPVDGWTPPEDWAPDPAWGPVPAGWRLWVEDDDRKDLPASPLQVSEAVPATGAKPRPRVDAYPVTAINPGMWSQNHLEDEDYGFGEAKPYRRRPGLRLTGAILSLVLGALLVVATVLIFRWGYHYAVDELPTTPPPGSSCLVCSDTASEDV